MSRNLYRYHADGTPRTPRLGTLCAHPNSGGDPMWGHTWCGAVGHVGEDGIKPNTFYRCDDNGRFVEVEK